MARSRSAKTAPAAPAPADIDFRAIVESAADVIYTLDLEGRLTYLNPRAYEVFGYDRAEGDRFLGQNFVVILAPGAAASAVGAIRHRVEFPHDRNVFRISARHKSGAAIPLEVHGGPLLRDGHMVGRVGICRVLEAGERGDGVQAHMVRPDVLQEERMRIARGLRDAVAQVVFGVTPHPDATESSLVDVKRATIADLARRLDLDDVDLVVLRLIAAGASNREIATTVHLSPAAIKDRIRRIMDRLGAHRRSELAAHALRLGIA